MPKEFSRTERVNEQIQRELAGIIQTELKDPRIKLITLTSVDISPDFAQAKIFFTSLEQTGGPKETIKALNQAAGFLRRELARRMTIRVIPQLHFFYDKSVERGVHLSQLIDEAMAADKKYHKDEDV